LFALQVTRRLVHLHFEQSSDALAIAEPVAQRPKERQLALERAQPRRVEAVLENAKLARLGVAGDPDFTEPTLAELALDEPARAAGDLLVDSGDTILNSAGSPF